MNHFSSENPPGALVIATTRPALSMRARLKLNLPVSNEDGKGWRIVDEGHIRLVIMSPLYVPIGGTAAFATVTATCTAIFGKHRLAPGGVEFIAISAALLALSLLIAFLAYRAKKKHRRVALIDQITGSVRLETINGRKKSTDLCSITDLHLVFAKLRVPENSLWKVTGEVYGLMLFGPDWGMTLCCHQFPSAAELYYANLPDELRCAIPLEQGYWNIMVAGINEPTKISPRNIAERKKMLGFPADAKMSLIGLPWQVPGAEDANEAR